MSKVNQDVNDLKGLGYACEQISLMATSTHRQHISKDNTKYLLGLEGLNEGDFGQYRTSHKQLEAQLRQIWEDAYSAESYGADSKSKPQPLTSVQVESGAMALAAFGNPVAYAEKAAKGLVPSQEAGVIVIPAPSASVADFRMVSSNEAFNENELRDHMQISVSFNVAAARQGEFSEAFYPTLVVSPDRAGLDMTVRRPMVLNEIRHLLSGTPIDFNRKNLVDAVIDPTILANVANSLIPVVIASGPDTNTQYFVASGDVTPANKATDAGQQVLTAPLKIGPLIGFLGICQRDDIQTQGVFDRTDSMDPKVNLAKLWLKVVAPDPANAGQFLTSVIPVDVSRTPRNQWMKSIEGQYKELALNFINTDIPLTGATPDKSGSPATALGFLNSGSLAGYFLRLNITVTGPANVEQGSIQAIAAPVTISKVILLNEDGTQVDQTAAHLAAATTALGTITVIGYEVAATRSNLNKRTRGLQVDTQEYTERYTIPLQSPVTIIGPVTNNRDAADIALLIQTVRIRNDNNAVTTLLNYESALSTLMASQNRQDAVPAIEGMGRYMVRPFYEAIPLDMYAAINSIVSHNRIEDVRSVLVNTIQEVAYRMYRDSGYQPALDTMTGNSGERPIILIGTDAVISKYLMNMGDTRLAGVQLDTKVVVSLDERMWGKIYVTLTRANQSGPDPLCFGQFAWMPELAATIQVSRNNETVKESGVQPRTLHINNLPILAAITVTNLSEVVTTATRILMHSV